MTGSWRAGRAAFAISIVAIFALQPLVCDAEMLAISPTETLELGFNDFAVLVHFLAHELARVDFVFSTTDGARIDLLLLNETGYEGYRLGMNVSGLAGSILNQSQAQGTITDLSSGQEYYIVVDNTAQPSGGGSPDGSVEVACGFIGSNVTELSDDATWISIALVLAFVVFILIIFLAARSKIAEREPGSEVRSFGMKYCPNCGEIVATWTHKCPKCGHEW